MTIGSIYSLVISTVSGHLSTERFKDAFWTFAFLSAKRRRWLQHAMASCYCITFVIFRCPFFPSRYAILILSPLVVLPHRVKETWFWETTLRVIIQHWDCIGKQSRQATSSTVWHERADHWRDNPSWDVVLIWITCAFEISRRNYKTQLLNPSSLRRGFRAVIRSSRYPAITKPC